MKGKHDDPTRDTPKEKLDTPRWSGVINRSGRSGVPVGPVLQVRILAKLTLSWASTHWAFVKGVDEIVSGHQIG